MFVAHEMSTASKVRCEPRYFESFEAAAIAIALCDFDGRILEANPALARMLDIDPVDLAGCNLNRFQQAGHSDDRAQLFDQDLVGQLIRGARESFRTEGRFVRKDASTFWGQLSVSLACNVHGDPAFLVAVLEDVSGRKRVEDNLRQAEKMEAIGRLAGGVAHDFNNLLTGILLYCDLILAGLEPGHPVRAHVEGVQMAADQGTALTQQLLAMARKQAAEPRALDVNEIVLSTERLLRRLIGEQIDLLIAVEASGELVLADPVQLRQILLNLVLNARDALASRREIGSGKIRVSTRINANGADRDSRDHPTCVSLTVEDNGCGMNADTRAHLFEPFFTTKKPGEGTGLGLATVQHIVNETRGHLEIASEIGCGTRITVIFPALAPTLVGPVTPVPGPPIAAPPTDSPLLEIPNTKGDSSC